MDVPTESFKIHRRYKEYPYKINLEKSSVKIPLFNFHLKIVGYTYIDLDDLPRVAQYCFSRKIRKCKGGADHYAISNLSVRLHHIIIGRPAEGYVIDHLDHNGLNNRKDNLDPRTYSQNAQNKAKKIGCRSEYIGVDLIKDTGKWRARITVNSVRHQLGCFDDEEKAGTCYDVYAIWFFGKNAQTNNLLDPLSIPFILKQGPPKGYRTTDRGFYMPANICRVLTVDGLYTGKCRVKMTVKKGETYLSQDYSTNTICDSMADAISFRDKFIDDVHRLRPITRNNEGFATLYVQSAGCVYGYIVDDHIWHDLRRHTLSKNGNYCNITIGAKTELLHRYIYRNYVGPIPKTESIDHFTSVRPYDNRLCNLRSVSLSLQNHNKQKRPGTLDEYRGVNYMKGKYHAFVGHKSHGSYDSAEEAAEHANRLFTEKYGSNAVLNIIDPDKTTTRFNRIPDEMITEEFINDLKFVKDLRDIIIKKALNVGQGGTIRTEDICSKYFDWLKFEMIRLLFPNRIVVAPHIIIEPLIFASFY